HVALDDIDAEIRIRQQPQRTLEIGLDTAVAIAGDDRYRLPASALGVDQILREHRRHHGAGFVIGALRCPLDQRRVVRPLHVATGRKRSLAMSSELWPSSRTLLPRLRMTHHFRRSPRYSTTCVAGS